MSEGMRRQSWRWKRICKSVRLLCVEVNVCEGNRNSYSRMCCASAPQHPAGKRKRRHQARLTDGGFTMEDRIESQRI